MRLPFLRGKEKEEEIEAQRKVEEKQNRLDVLMHTSPGQLIALKQMKMISKPRMMKDLHYAGSPAPIHTPIGDDTSRGQGPAN